MKKEDKLLLMKMCSDCKLKIAKKCEGFHAIKGSVLQHCPFYLDRRVNTIINNKTQIPYPIEESEKNDKK